MRPKRVIMENWNYCHYQSGKMKAFVSYLATPNGDDIIESYAVTTRNDNSFDVFSQEFPELYMAVEHLNTRYGHWDFVDTSTKDGGCDSCSAH